MTLAIVAIVLLLSAIIHELAHGYTALLNGDTTAKNAGRLSFNPMRHIDTFGTIILPVALILMRSPVVFGWAKPVPINPMNFRNRKKGVITVSLAGPFSNFMLILLAALIWRIFPHNPALNTVLMYTVLINAVLGVFNLIPIPPLDGSHVMGLFLPKNIRCHYYAIGRYGFLILFGLLWLGLFDRVVAPVVEWIMRSVF